MIPLLPCTNQYEFSHLMGQDANEILLNLSFEHTIEFVRAINMHKADGKVGEASMQFWKT